MTEGTAGINVTESTRDRARQGATRKQPILLKKLLRERNWHMYRRFKKEYDRAAGKFDKELVGTCPSEDTFRRWLAGKVIGIPRSAPSSVLEHMFPQYTVEQLFETCEDGGSAVGVPDEQVSTQVPGAEDETLTGHEGAITPFAPVAVDRPIGQELEAKNVNRKNFIAGLAATIAAPTLPLSPSTPAARVGAADVARFRHKQVQLYALDDHYGAANEVYGLTVRLVRRLQHILASSSYSLEVGDQLRTITGEVMEHAGWLAFSAGQDHDARYWWLEALHIARMANDPQVEVVVLASMSHAAGHYGRGREAVDLATRAAQIVRRDRPSSRLLSLLAAREALGHAHTGDRNATRQALDRAGTDLHRGAHDDDPAWLEFWGPSDLACYVSAVARQLGDLTTAERSGREAVITVDATHYPRNLALYQIDLAGVLVAQRNLDEGIPLVTTAVLQATDIHSKQLVDGVRTVVRDLRTHHGDRADVRDLAEWTTTTLSPPSPWPTT
jgi:hypothetical protein